MRSSRWSAEEDAELLRLVESGTKNPGIARDLDRTQMAVSARMATLGIYRGEKNRKVSGVAAEHIRIVERRSVKADEKIVASNPVKRGRGRPLGSKNKGARVKVALDRFGADGPDREGRINAVLQKAEGL
ncbi:hypothetical protein [Sphingomonas sp. UYP23]